MPLGGGSFVVVGGASLAGTHIAEALLAADAARVVLLDNFSLSSSDALAGLPIAADPRVSVVKADILRLPALLDALAGADGVFHVAAYLAGPLVADPWTGIDVNVRGLQNVLEASRHNGLRKVVISSSVGVYGHPGDGEVTEDHPYDRQGVAPAMSLYCESKLMAESLCRLAEQTHGLRFAALRYSSIYGARQHGHSINARLIADVYEALADGNAPDLPNGGSEVHDYVYVTDVAAANLLAMSADVSGEAFTIATGEARSLAEAADHLGRLMGVDPGAAAAKEGSPERLSFTTTTTLRYSREKARRMLGWEPRVGFEEGLERFLAWRTSIGS